MQSVTKQRQLTLLRFATSSSHDEVKHTRAGTLSFIAEPGAKATAILESIEQKNGVEGPRVPRREKFHKRIRRFFSYLTRSNYRTPRPVEGYPPGLPKMFHDDAYASFHPEDPYLFADNNLVELPSYDFQAPIDWPAPSWTTEVEGTLIVELNDEAQMRVRRNLSLDVAHPLITSLHNVAVAPDVDALPQLSPHASQDSSPVSSLTPSTTQRAITPPLFSDGAHTHSASPDGTNEPQKPHYEEQLAHSQTFHSVRNALYTIDTVSTMDMSDAASIMPFMSWESFEDRRVDDNSACGLRNSHSPIQAPSQRATTMPTRLSDEDRQRLSDSGLGTFELDPSTSTYVRRPDGWTSSKLCNACNIPLQSENPVWGTSRVGTIQDEVQVRLDHQQDFQQTAAAEAEVHAPVKCDVCSQEFHGKYGPGNLRRHARTIHAATPLIGSRLTCHICKTTYKRSDALRSHLWRKHSLPEARPKPKSVS